MEPTNCVRCQKSLAASIGSCTISTKDGKLQEVICWGCDQVDRIQEYQKTKELTTSLVTSAGMYRFRSTENPDGLDRLHVEARHFYKDRKNGLVLEEINAAYDEIVVAASDFTIRQWYPTLQTYYQNSDVRGHNAVTEDWKILMWGSAGRVLVTVQDTKPQGQGKFGGAWITLYFVEDAAQGGGSVQGLCATKEEAIGLLRAATLGPLVMVSNGDVSVAGV